MPSEGFRHHVPVPDEHSVAANYLTGEGERVTQPINIEDSSTCESFNIQGQQHAIHQGALPSPFQRLQQLTANIRLLPAHVDQLIQRCNEANPTGLGHANMFSLSREIQRTCQTAEAMLEEFRRIVTHYVAPKMAQHFDGAPPSAYDLSVWQSLRHQLATLLGGWLGCLTEIIRCEGLEGTAGLYLSQPPPRTREEICWARKRLEADLQRIQWDHHMHMIEWVCR